MPNVSQQKSKSEQNENNRTKCVFEKVVWLEESLWSYIRGWSYY